MIDADKLKSIPMCSQISSARNFTINECEGIICKVLKIPDDIEKPKKMRVISGFCNNCGHFFKKTHHYGNHMKTCNLKDVKKMIESLNHT
jgi:hypothetical protein